MDNINIIAAVLFAIALVHTFAAKSFERLADHHPKHAGLLHLLGEIEVVFGFWACILLLVMAFTVGGTEAIAYAESRQYTEPLFVFVVMIVAASRPILEAVKALVAAIATLVPVNSAVARVWLGLALVPLIGSLITEPAAMTLAALILAPQVFRQGIPEWLKYGALGVLFVNVSIGGTLTSFAAPPVLMVATTWQWDSLFMASHFGWKACIAVMINATVITFLLRSHVATAKPDRAADTELAVPWLVRAIHLVFLAAVVLFAHHPVIFLGIFLFFLAIYVGYHVVWTVTPALHTPLMAVTNAISAIIIVGAMLAAGLTEGLLGQVMGTLAVALAAVNVFGGFLVTQRMLEMFRKKEPKAARNSSAEAQQ
jgi:hypothetical protein